MVSVSARKLDLCVSFVSELLVNASLSNLFHSHMFNSIKKVQPVYCLILHMN